MFLRFLISRQELLISNVTYHSIASKFYIKIYITHSEAHFIISDNGIGIFKNIQSGLNLHSAQLAVLELAKETILLLIPINIPVMN